MSLTTVQHATQAVAQRRPGAHWAAGVSRMDNPVKAYAWGSRTLLADLQGRAAAPGPEAELWLGAHPHGPSVLVSDRGERVDLDRAVRGRSPAVRPAELLGPDCSARFGSRLPFLLKVLAVSAPLSVQVHPTAADAAGGTGLLFDDPWPKPEQFVALTHVEALAGLRPRREAAALLARLGVEALEPVVDLLVRGSTAQALVALSAGRDAGADLARAVGRAATHLVTRTPPGPDADAYAWVARISGHHPDDPLVAAPLLLRLLRIGPGSSVAVPAGTPHAYLGGLAVEVQGASDNVVRAGLTVKHVDPALFRRVLRERDVVVEPAPEAQPGTWHTWRGHAEEFSLHRVVLDGGRVPLPPARPQVLLCVSGRAEVRWDGATVALSPGTSAFVGGASGPVGLTGRGEVFAATTG